MAGPFGCFNDEMPPAVFGDLSDDGVVNGAGMGLLLAAWGNGRLRPLSWFGSPEEVSPPPHTDSS